MKTEVHRKQRPKVSCIIPAHNEAARIGGVLGVVESHPWITQVIVVNDGSTDHTAKVTGMYKKITLINLAHNRGKSHAVMKGIEAAKHDLLMTLDADLVGLTHEDVDALLRPVLVGAVDTTISMRNNALLIYKLIELDFVSGERVFHKRILRHKQLKHLQGYGLEVFLNKEIIKRKLRIGVVKWRTVSHVRKGAKVGFFKGWKLETHMVLQILRTVGIRQVLYQIWKMRQQSR